MCWKCKGTQYYSLNISKFITCCGINKDVYDWFYPISFFNLFDLTYFTLNALHKIHNWLFTLKCSNKPYSRNNVISSNEKNKVFSRYFKKIKNTLKLITQRFPSFTHYPIKKRISPYIYTFTKSSKKKNSIKKKEKKINKGLFESCPEMTSQQTTIDQR